jgi:DNA-binding NarL/FixJ family response regulator
VVRVLLADDSELMLKAIGRLLTNCPEVELIGQTSKFEAILALAEFLKPDVIVIDLGMLDRANGDAASAEIQRLNALDSRLLAISAATVDDKAKAFASNMGAEKLLDKMELDEKLIPTILELAAG